MRLPAAAMVFLGACLAFGMEPIVGRLVTPFFGGAVHVWTVTLMVFQALLLVGYWYAHRLAPRLGAWHLAVLALPLAQWPLDFATAPAPEAPIAALVGALLGQIALPFAVLSTSAVVAQGWWQRSPRVPPGEPYFLYAWSNAGALLALLAYPFLVEPLAGLRVQRWAWSLAYLAYAATVLWTWRRLRPGAPATGAVPPAPPWRRRGHWLLLAAAPSALLLAVTNAIALEAGSFPLVWTVPLALYLASFIVAFAGREPHWSDRCAFWVVEAALALLAVQALAGGRGAALPGLLAGFFVLCVAAHRRLYRLRPPAAGLSGFYLHLAVGGWLGGLAVSLGAPQLFSGLQELPLALAAVVAACVDRRWLAWWRQAPIGLGGPRLLLLAGGVGLAGLAAWASLSDSREVFRVRNFYGISRVRDYPATPAVPAHRELLHGATVHGMQYLEPARRGEPLGYYYRGGALESAARLRPPAARVAMLGLGSGGALAWFGAGDAVNIFEIDPAVVRLARDWFVFLGATPARTALQLGDARLRLQQESGAPPYDLIFVDTFSGDGIPTHLLTREALAIYLARLGADGVLLFHVSNRFYDLRPVLAALARTAGLSVVATAQRAATGDPLRIGQWAVAMARRPQVLAPLLAGPHWQPVDALPAATAWRDDDVNILAPLAARWGF